MNNIDDLKDKITHSKERIKFGFNLIRSMEKRIDLKKKEIEEFKLTAEADLIKTKAESKKCLKTAMILAVFNTLSFLHLKLAGLLIISYMSKEIAYAQTGNSSFLERQTQPTNVFNGGIFETLKYNYLSYDNLEVFTLISLIVVSAYLLTKLLNHCRSTLKLSVLEHIEIHDLKIINKINCYQGYIIKVRNEIQQDRLKIREAKYKLRLLERN